jgi:hypothetical protein
MTPHCAAVLEAATKPIRSNSVQASVTWRTGAAGAAKSSVRSAMFIAIRAARSAKLRRSGMYSLSLGHYRRSVGAKIPIHAAPMELGRASGAVVTINMPLLTERAVCVAEDACKVQPHPPQSKTLARGPGLAPVRGRRVQKPLGSSPPVTGEKRFCPACSKATTPHRTGSSPPD